MVMDNSNIIARNGSKTRMGLGMNSRWLLVVVIGGLSNQSSIVAGQPVAGFMWNVE